jgi:hypothetical protein
MQSILLLVAAYDLPRQNFCILAVSLASQLLELLSCFCLGGFQLASRLSAFAVLQSGDHVPGEFPDRQHAVRAVASAAMIALAPVASVHIRTG